MRIPAAPGDSARRQSTDKHAAIPKLLIPPRSLVHTMRRVIGQDGALGATWAIQLQHKKHGQWPPPATHTHGQAYIQST